MKTTITIALVASVLSGVMGWYTREYIMYKHYYETTQNAAIRPIPQ